MENKVPMVNNGWGESVPAMPTIVSDFEAARVSKEEEDRIKQAQKKKAILLKHSKPEFRQIAQILEKNNARPEDYAVVFDNLSKLFNPLN